MSTHHRPARILALALTLCLPALEAKGFEARLIDGRAGAPVPSVLFAAPQAYPCFGPRARAADREARAQMAALNPGRDGPALQRLAIMAAALEALPDCATIFGRGAPVALPLPGASVEAGQAPGQTAKNEAWQH